TLGGLALAVGILVDEATVTIENIHTHLTRGKTLARSALDATSETALPRLLAMLCILAVFTPALFMSGAAKSLFLPLSLAVGFSMIASFLLSNTLVPILSVWWMRTPSEASRQEDDTGLARFQAWFTRGLSQWMRLRAVVIICYIILSG